MFRKVEKVKEISYESDEGDFGEYIFLYVAGVRLIKKDSIDDKVNVPLWWRLEPLLMLLINPCQS